MHENMKTRKTYMDSSLIAMTPDEDIRERVDEKMHWQVIDVITSQDGSVEERVYYNTVVENCSKLIASLIKGHTNVTAGKLFWAVGSGDIAWNDATPPTPSASAVKLTNETFRKAVTSINFIDNSNNVTATVTNKLEIKITFETSEANGALREFAIFGGLTSNTTKDSGIMMNWKIHPLINKTSGMKIDRTIRLTF